MPVHSSVCEQTFSKIEHTHPRNPMSRATASALVVLGLLQPVGCGGDDTVNPSNPDASATAAKDATTGDAKASDGGSGDAKGGGDGASESSASDGSASSDGSGGGKEAAADASGGGAEAATDAAVGDAAVDGSSDALEE
jgi:hypothetical protein